MAGMRRLGSRLVYRLPGPRTMSSASAIAARASSDAWTSSGVIQTRSMPCVRMISRLAIDDRAVAPPGVERERRRRDRHDLAAHGQDAIDPTDALLEIAALHRSHRGEQQVAHRVPREAGRLGPSAASAATGKRYCSSSPHERFGVREGRDAVADVAHRRDPELRAQHAGRAAVVGHGDHRRQVARVFLEPAQQGRQTGPATDRDDPRSPREEPLLVDDLDQRLVGIGGPQRLGDDAQTR